MILKKHFWKNRCIYNRNLFYDEKNKNLFDSNQYAFFGENGTTIDYQYFANFEKQIIFNDKNVINNHVEIKNNYTMLKKNINWNNRFTF